MVKTFKEFINEATIWDGMSKGKLPKSSPTLIKKLLGELIVKSEEDSVKDITPSIHGAAGKSEREKLLGDDFFTNTLGLLATKYPQYFADDVIQKLFPDVATTYARQIMLLHLLEPKVFYYGRGKGDFRKWEGFQLAKEAGKEYVWMENLS